MKKKSEKTILSCPACHDSFQINRKSRRPQEVGVVQPLEKKNPFHIIQKLIIPIDDKISNTYEMTICESCGNIFGVLLEENLKSIDENGKKTE